MLNRNPKHFSIDGYCLFKGVFNGEEVKSNQILMNEASVAGLSCGGFSSIGKLDRPNYLGEPHVRDDRWLQICRHQRLLDAVESVLGPNLILVYSSVFIKPPKSVDTVPWHQDNNYWPSVHGTKVVTVWMAIDDANKKNSAMRVIPGSHVGFEEQVTVPSVGNEMLNKKIVVSPEMEACAVTLEMAAGSVSIHDSFLYHSSEKNRTGRRRAGYTIRYCSTDTSWVDLDEHPIPVYLVRGKAGKHGERYIDLRPKNE